MLHNESIPSQKKKIIVLGSGPNRIGQGIEFDYCCTHGLLAIKECGYEAIMINCNPETVSTDFDIADKLYFEPVYWEHLWEIIEHEKPEGVIVQLGGQTALKLAKRLHEKGIKIIGTSFDDMDIAEDRGRFSDLLEQMHIPFPKYGTAFSTDDAIEVAKALKAEGVAYICCSSGGNSPHQKLPGGPGYQVDLAEAVKRGAGIPTRAVGLITEPAQANAIVADGRADMVALGRAFLADPRWGWRAAAALGEKIQPAPQLARAVTTMEHWAKPA